MRPGANRVPLAGSGHRRGRLCPLLTVHERPQPLGLAVLVGALDGRREDAAADVSGPQAPPVEVPNTSASAALSIGAYFLSSPIRTGSTSTVQSALKCRCSTARYPSKQAELATEEALLHGRPERQRHGDPRTLASPLKCSSPRRG